MVGRVPTTNFRRKSATPKKKKKKKITHSFFRIVGQIWCLAFLIAYSLAPPLYGQKTTGAIFGSVNDSTGAFIPGASVEVKNTDTGATRMVQTDDRGAYWASALSPGNYEVQAFKTRFKAAHRTGIGLTVGQEAAIDLTLGQVETEPGTETVTVREEAPLVDTTATSTVSGLVSNSGIRDLPLNGRSFEQLAILQPGVTANTQSGGQFFGGRTLKISVGGARGSMNTYVLDGTTIDNVWNSTPGSATGLLLGVETIREFRVLINNYSAEYGKNAGGVIDIVTLSGTNTLHGTVYEFLRNSALDAKNFFDSPTQPIPAFKRNQFGASLGGPIRKDRIFFHANYEGLRERTGVSLVASVPDASVHQGLLPDPTNPGQLVFVGISPRIQPYLNLLPLPNGPSLGGGVSQWIGSATQPSSENYFSGRLDYTISEKDFLFGRYTFDDGDSTPVGDLPLLGAQETSRMHYVSIQETHLFSSTVLNTAHFGFARNYLSLQPKQLVPISSTLNFASGRPFGEAGGIVIDPLHSPAGDPLANCPICPEVPVLNNFEWADTLDWVKGKHTIKAGLQISRIQFNNSELVAPAWEYDFPSLADFLQAQPAYILGAPVNGDPIRALRQSLYAAFLQDEFRISPNFGLSLGLRYENMTSPSEANGKGSRWVNPTDPAPTLFGHNPIYLDFTKFGFMPRLGFAWDPFKNGKTSVRSGFGLFYDQLGPLYNSAISTEPPYGQFTLKLSPTFPTDTIRLGPPYFLEDVAPTHAPYVVQYNLNVQRQLSPNTEISIGFAGSSGVHLVVSGDTFKAIPTILANGQEFFPPNAQRINSLVSSASMKMTRAHSRYDALVLSLNRRFALGFSAEANYTFSKEIDDSSEEYAFTDENSNKNTQDPRNPRAGRGLGSFDRKDNLSFNLDYNLPFGANLQGPLNRLAKGWDLSAIVLAYSGFPVNVTESVDRSNDQESISPNSGERPNLCPGASNNPGIGNPSHWMSSSSFCLQPAGFYGNLGRNTVIGPGLVNLDFSVMKDTSLHERMHLQFIAQFFNFLNHPNFGVPANVVFSDTTGVPLPNFGVISQTATTSRQLQFALKLLF